MTDEEMVEALAPIQESIKALREPCEQLVIVVRQLSNDINALWATYTHRNTEARVPEKPPVRRLVRRT